jgi:hypothetical protein
MRRLAGATMLMPLLAMKRDTMLIYGVKNLYVVGNVSTKYLLFSTK